MAAGIGHHVYVTNIHRPGEPVLSAVAPQAVKAMSTDLAKLDSMWQQLDIVVLTPPKPGSPAERERQTRYGAYAYDQAVTAIRAALDHLRAWKNLLTAGQVPTYAHLSILRTAHEAALGTLWIVEPGITAPERLARGVAAQAADYEERRKLEAAIGLTNATPPGRLGGDRLADLMAEAKTLGLTRLDRRGDTILTVSVPATVDLFDRFEPVPPRARGQFVYRLYSGYAHAKQWALLLGAQRQAPYDEHGRTIALTQASDDVAVAATHRTVNAVERAIDALEQLYL